MTTATETTAAASIAAPTPTVDLDTRLDLAAIGMDVTMQLAAGAALAEADAEAAAAILEAQSTEDPATVFPPHPALAKARRIIESRGWTRGEYVASSGAVCAMAAIREAVYGPGWHYRAFDQRELEPAAELMNRIAADTGYALSVPAWNDSRSDVSEVVRLLY